MNKLPITEIYLDIDGVFADFDTYYDALRKEHGVVEEWNPELFHDQVKNHGLFTKLNMYPESHGFKMFFDMLSTRRDVRVEMLSSAGMPKHKSEAYYQKLVWLREHNFMQPLNVTPTANDKIAFCKGAHCILIDDREDTIKKWREAGGVGYLYDTKNHDSTQKEIIHDLINMLL